MHQTPFFTNHGLHIRFDIQGVNNVVNLATGDWVAWLIDFQTQLISNLEEVRRRYKENANKHHKDQPNFTVEDQIWIWRQNIKTTQRLKKLDYQIFGSFTIVKQIYIVAFQLKFPDSMKVHPMFHVSLLEPYTMLLPFQREHMSHLHQL